LSEFFAPVKGLGVVNMFAWMLLVVAPIAYLAVAFVIDPQPSTPAGDAEMLVGRILVALALIGPLLTPLIERTQLTTFRRNTASAMTTEQMLRQLVIIRLALVEAVFIYGLTMRLITGSLTWMALFYVIGAGWAVLRWPTDGRVERLRAKIEEIKPK
jgi:hypothetical protein